MDQKVPKDLGLIVGDEEEAFWFRCKKETETEIKGLERSLKFHRAILEMIMTKPLPKQKK